MKRVLQDAGIRAVAGMVLIAVAGCNYSPGEPGEKQATTTVAAAHRAAKAPDRPSGEWVKMLRRDSSVPGNLDRLGQSARDRR